MDLRKTTHEYVKCSFLDEGYSSEEVSDILHNKSGLYGISGKIYFLTYIVSDVQDAAFPCIFWLLTYRFMSFNGPLGSC